MKKVLILLAVLVFILAGCTPAPGDLVGPISSASPPDGIWTHVVNVFCWMIVISGHFLGNNVVWGLVFMTVAFRLAMVPLYKAQISSSANMAKIQPDMAKIKAKYAGRSDQESKMKMNTEMQALYKEQGINPFAGCLPMLIQMPLLFMFYGAISNLMVYTDGGMDPETGENVGQTALHLYNSTLFGGIDGATMGMNFMFWDNMADPIAFFAILAAITTYYATSISTYGTADPEIVEVSKVKNGQATTVKKIKPAKSANADMMRSMKIVMPIMILWMGFTFPGALALYWSIGNIFTIVQTLIVRRKQIADYRAKAKLLEAKL